MPTPQEMMNAWADSLNVQEELMPQQQPTVAKSGFLRRALGDTAVSAMKGIIGVPEALVGLADIPTGGAVGNVLEQAGVKFKESKDILNQMYSPEQQAVQKDIADTKGFVNTIKAYVQNPSAILQSAVESAPTMLTGGGLARGLVKGGIGAAIAGGIGEGLVTTGQQAEQTRQEKGSLGVKEAGSALASGAGTALFGILGGKIAQRLNIGDVDTILAGGINQGVAEGVAGKFLGADVKKGILRKIAESALSEGIAEELPQSMQEQAWANIASGRPWHEGVAEAGASGMIVGGLMGAAGGGFNAVGTSGGIDQAANVLANPVQVDEAGKFDPQHVQTRRDVAASIAGIINEKLGTEAAGNWLYNADQLINTNQPIAFDKSLMTSRLNFTTQAETTPQATTQGQIGYTPLLEEPIAATEGEVVRRRPVAALLEGPTPDIVEGEVINPRQERMSSLYDIADLGIKQGAKYENLAAIIAEGGVDVKQLTQDLGELGFKNLREYYDRIKTLNDTYKRQIKMRDPVKRREAIAARTELDAIKNGGDVAAGNAFRETANQQITTEVRPTETVAPEKIDKAVWTAKNRKAGDDTQVGKETLPASDLTDKTLRAQDLYAVSSQVDATPTAVMQTLREGGADMSLVRDTLNHLGFTSVGEYVNHVQSLQKESKRLAKAKDDTLTPRRNEVNAQLEMLKRGETKTSKDKSGIVARLDSLLSNSRVEDKSKLPGYTDMVSKGGSTVSRDSSTGELVFDSRDVSNINKAIKDGRLDVASVILTQLEAAKAHESIHGVIYNGSEYNKSFVEILNNIQTALSSPTANYQGLKKFVEVGLKHLLAIPAYKSQFESYGVDMSGSISDQTKAVLNNTGALTLAVNELLAGHNNTRGAWSKSELSSYIKTRNTLLDKLGVDETISRELPSRLNQEHIDYLKGVSNAAQTGKQSEGNIAEHKDGDKTRKGMETSGGDSTEQSKSEKKVSNLPSVDLKKAKTLQDVDGLYSKEAFEELTKHLTKDDAQKLIDWRDNIPESKVTTEWVMNNQEHIKALSWLVQVGKVRYGNGKHSIKEKGWGSVRYSKVNPNRTTPLTVAQVQSAINSALKALPEGIQKVIKIVNDPTANWDGVFVGGKIMLNAAQIYSPTRAREVLLDHELRHMGLSEMFGGPKKLAEAMKKAFVGNESAVARFAMEHGYTGSIEEAVEEYIVSKAKEAKDITFLNKVVAIFRRWLRGHGFSGLNFSNSEMLEMVSRSGQAVGVDKVGRQPLGEDVTLQYKEQTEAKPKVETTPENRASKIAKLGHSRGFKYGNFYNFLVKEGQDIAKLNSQAKEMGFASFRELYNSMGGEARYHSAWHGTPHQVDKFSTDKIGTGEGAQAFGYGLYFAGNKEVAEWYRDKLSGGGIEFNGERYTGWFDKNLLEAMKKEGGVLYAVATKRVLEEYDSVTDAIDAVKSGEAIEGKENQDAVVKLLEKIKEVKGSLYQVELTPTEDEYLLWDKPLSEQSEKVKDALNPVIDLWFYSKNEDGDEVGRTRLMESMTGEYLYNYDDLWKEVDVAGAMSFDGDKSVSEYLHSLGIRGIKYLDNTSRAKGDGFHNYVIFDENDIEILARYSRVKSIGGDILIPDSKLIQYAISDSKYVTPDKFKSYITMMRPQDFLNMAASGGMDLRSRVSKYQEFDESKLNELPILFVTGEGRIEGHEGRARMTLMDKAGIVATPVVIRGNKTFGPDNKAPKTLFDESYGSVSHFIPSSNRLELTSEVTPESAIEWMKNARFSKVDHRGLVTDTKMLDSKFNKVHKVTGKPVSEVRTTLGELVSHNELFKSNPELRDVEVVIKKGESRQGHSGLTVDGRIVLYNYDNLVRNRLFNRTLVHEIEHLMGEDEDSAYKSDFYYAKGDPVQRFSRPQDMLNSLGRSFTGTIIEGAKAISRNVLPRDRMYDKFIMHAYNKPVVEQLKRAKLEEIKQIAKQNVILDEMNTIKDNWVEYARKYDQLDKVNEFAATATLWGIYGDKAANQQPWTSDEWTIAGMQEKTRLTFKEAHSVVRGMYNSLDPAVQKAYKSLVAQMKSLREQDKAAREEFINNLPGVSDEKKAGLLKRIDRFYNNIKGPYLPLGRFGKYTVQVRNASGGIVYNESVDTEMDAIRVLNLKRAEFGNTGYKFEMLDNRRVFTRDRINVTMEFVDKLKATLAAKSLSHAKKAANAEIRSYLSDASVIVDDEINSGLSEVKAATTMDELVRAVDKLSSVVGDRRLNNETLVGISDALKEAGLDEDTRSTINSEFEDLFLRSQPESSTYKNSISRKAIAGFEKDMLRSAIGYADKHSKSIAYLLHGSKVDAAYREIGKKAKELLDAGTISTEDAFLINTGLKDLQQTRQDIVSEKVNPFVSTVNKLAFFKFLTSPSTFIVQSMQPWTITLPKLAAKYGFAKASKLLAKYNTSQFGMTYANDKIENFDQAERFKPAGWAPDEPFSLVKYVRTLELSGRSGEANRILSSLTPREVEYYALKRAMLDGSINVTQSHEAREYLMGGGKSSEATKKLAAAASWFMQTSELTSRKAAFLTAFECARSEGKSIGESVKVANQVVRETLYDYSQLNRPKILTGNIGRLVGQFRVYQVQTLCHLLNLGHKSVNTRKLNVTPEERAQARKELTYIALMNFMFAGAAGVPLSGAVSTLMGLFTALFSDADDPFDWMEEAQKAMLESTTGTAVLKGLPTLIGMDISKRVGMGGLEEIIAGEPPEKANAVDKANWYAAKILGPGYNVVSSSIFGATEGLKTGEWNKAMQAVMPKPIADVARAWGLSDNGLKDFTGTTVIPADKVSVADLALMAAGINPVEIAKTSQRSKVNANVTARIEERQKLLRSKLFEAIQDQDQDSITEAVDNIVAFNTKVPVFALNSESLKSGVVAAMKRAYGIGGKTATKLEIARENRG